MSDLVFSASGPQPTPPATLRAQLDALCQAAAPGYTSELPGSLIEDVASTCTYAVALCDSARVETLNSLNPLGSNPFLLNQLGQIYGVPLGEGSTTSAYIVVTGPHGFSIPKGFTVSDGTYQYVTQDAGTIGDGSPTGESQPLYVLSTTQGTWAVPADSITQIASSVPPGISLTVTNPQPGTPGSDPQTSESYRAQVLQAGLASSLGMPQLVKTAVTKIPNVQSRLVSMRQLTLAGWQILVGGGDPYQVAGAIFNSSADISLLVGSQINTGRNQTVSISNPPDTYTITYVVPPVQGVSMLARWNTTAPNIVSNDAFASLVTPALVAYINSITVGSPINILELQFAFQQAVSPLIPTPLLTSLLFEVSINGTVTTPITGTQIIPGDPESYFYMYPSGVTTSQG